MRPDEPATTAERPDLRMPLLGAAAWAGGVLGAIAAPHVLLALAATVLLATGAVWLRRGSTSALTLLAVVLVGGAVVVSALLRTEQVSGGPVADLAADGAAVRLEATVTSDPRPVAGQFGDVVLVRLMVREVTGRGRTHRLRAPVLALAGEDWLPVRLGSGLRVTGRLGPADDDDLAAVLTSVGAPEVREDPDLWWRGAARVRAALRASVAHRPVDQRVLVPALVNGDDAGLDPTLADDFRTTGLTHLLAVSGTNLTLVVGFLLILGRWCGVRGRWHYLVGAVGIGGFVLLARTEPSVLRAAVMGAVALVALGRNGRQRGMRTLGVAVVGLLLVQPSLAVSAGFALSVLATAGILVLAPGWRDALGTWLPRWLAEAIAVPAAAQVACTPLVAAISGQVSLVAVLANLAVAPAVGPATVLGLAGALTGLVVPAVGQGFGTAASWCVGWIIAVAERGAELPSAAFDWGTGPLSLVALTLLCVVLALTAPFVLGHRTTAVCVALLGTVIVVVPVPTPGWPPKDWVLVACDVGQGDALVLRAGPRSAVVVDAGPDPVLMDRCLDRLGVRQVPLLVLTHFHADHVDGLAGVLAGRSVAAIETSNTLDPEDGVDLVRRTAQDVPLSAAVPGTRRVGDLILQVLAPRTVGVRDGPGDGSAANDASVVLLAEVRGLRILLTGDLEPAGQAALSRAVSGGLQVDVLKLPHHGSRHQDEDFLTSVEAEVVLVSVGADNTYGHPAPGVLELFPGRRVLRTDRHGDLAVVVRDGHLSTRTTR